MTAANLTTALDGTAKLTVKGLSKVTIDNILDLRSCGMSEVGGRTMHIFEWKNGGLAEVTYRADGAIENFRIEGGNMQSSYSRSTSTLVIGIAPGSYTSHKDL